MSKERESLALPANTVVGRYTLRHAESTWGFYLTYLAAANGTARPVLVHELLPEELVTRAADGTVQARTERASESLAWARDRFLLEGRELAACAHPAVEPILDVLEANGTAYWVTPVEEIRTLKHWLEAFHRAPTEAELRTLLDPLLSALQKLHDAGLYHLNLKLDSIRLTAGGKPMLIRFAGSRQAIARHSHEASAVTTGYSPIEQYDSDKAEGPWTDIYSLAAVLHRAITGKVPPEATLRLASDPYQKLAGQFSSQYRADFLSAIDAALAPDPTARPQSIVGWRRMLGIPAAEVAPALARRNVALLSAGAVFLLAVLGGGAWYVFRPKPVPPLVHPSDDGKKNAEDQKKAAEEKKKQEEEKKAAEAKAAEERQKEEEAKLAEAEKKAEDETKAAEKVAADKAEAAKQAEENAAQKSDAAKAAAEKAEAEAAAAEQAAKKAEEAKGAARKKTAENTAQGAAAKASESQSAADNAAADSAAADVAAKQAEAEKATAERTAAEKSVAEKSIEQQQAAAAKDRAIAESQAPADQSAAEKAAADQAAAEKAAENAEAAKAAAEKTVREKAAAEKEAAGKLAEAVAAQKALEAKAKSRNAPGENAAKENSPAAAEKAAAEKAAAEKAAAEKAAAEKAAAEKAAAEKAAQEMTAQKAAEEKAAAEKAAADKAAADKQNGTPSNPQSPGFSGPQGQVGSGLGGVWETSAKDAGGKPLKRLTIYPDATYELHSEAGTETGFIKAKLGIMELHPNNRDAGAVSTFTYKNMRVIETDGPLGKFEWVRVSPTAPERPKKEGQ